MEIARAGPIRRSVRAGASRLGDAGPVRAGPHRQPAGGREAGGAAEIISAILPAGLLTAAVLAAGCGPNIGRLVVVGEPARPMHLGACLEGSWGDESVFVADNDEALAWLREHLTPGDVVLLKASRAAALETVAEALLADNDGGEKETNG